jgi:outer membrane protein TolC
LARTPSFRFAALLFAGFSIALAAHSQSSGAAPPPPYPYPPFGPQVVAVPAIPFSFFSANVSIKSGDYYGSVLAAKDTGDVLPLSLDDSIRLGLKNNLALILTRDQVDVLHGRSQQALQNLLPLITGTAQTSVNQVNLAADGFNPSLFHERGITFNPIVKSDVTLAQANINWTAFSLTSIDQWRAAKIRQTASLLDSANSQQNVVLIVGNEYLLCISDAANVDNAKALLDADQALLNNAVELHKAGITANLDELRARVQFETQQLTLIQAENKFEKDKISLKRMIGLPAEQKIALTDPVPFADLETASLDDVRQRAYLARTDYLSQLQQVRVAELNRKAARWERLPTLSADGFYGVIGLTHGSYHGNFVFSAVLAFPIFEEAKLRGDRDVAQSQLDNAGANVASLHAQIDADLRDDYFDIQSTAELVKVARSNVDLATKELEQANDRFAAGVEDNLAVVDAQATLANAQSSLVDSLFRFNQAKLNLARSMGVVTQQYKEFLGGR